MLEPLSDPEEDQNEIQKSTPDFAQGSEMKLPDVVEGLFPEAAVNGLLKHFKMELTHVSSEIRQLTGKQDELLEKVETHNQELEASLEMGELAKVMNEMKMGLERLTKLRQDMNTVHDRSEKLKQRAEKLVTVRQTAERKEEELVAKMEPPPPCSEEK
ncbi:unnamed protein product [Orchesella dallaii]|uniref:Biogenesis of lysosome-related organelles complex 1 subunit 6 n=1 Tax=Orchesella dallaii TaxID=48710 RepID=A0ABP1PTH9_9HEXA